MSHLVLACLAVAATQLGHHALLVAVATVAFVAPHAWHHTRPLPTSIPDYAPNWPSVSREQKRRHPQCEVCGWHPGCWLGRLRELHAHHVWGLGVSCAPGDETGHDLMTVCTRCHARIHKPHRAMVRAGLDRMPYKHLGRCTRIIWWRGIWRRGLRWSHP